MSESSSLKDRRALVTGSSRGIGKGIALALAEAGCDVAVHYHTQQEAARETADEVEAMDRKSVVVQADVSEESQCEKLLDEVVDTLGTVDVLVNNAGIAEVQALEELSSEDWRNHLETNLSSAFRLTQGVIGPMRQQEWGRIINISSVAGQMGGLVGPHYAASKAGMLGLTRGYAQKLAGEGITANAIAPALVDTDMVPTETLDPDMIPVGRFGSIDETAEVAVMLARNGYITGQTINVDGGVYFT